MPLDPVKMRTDAEEFYRLLYAGAPREAVERFVGDGYVQHNPLAGDGTDSLIDYFERMAVEYPQKSVEVKRSVCEGNLLVLHCRQVWPGEVYASFDCFRFDDHGKIVEHWDVMQLIEGPDLDVEPRNDNGMF